MPQTMTPLDGTIVMDMTQSIAGPVCTQLLGEMGATVIKIEPPQGDAFRNVMQGSMFVPFNHGKQSLCVNLKHEEGQDLLTHLAEDADIIVESFRPGTLEKYNLDYQSVLETNNKIIYCSLSGFGQYGPYHDYPGYDPCIQAMSGLMATTGYSDRPPVRIRASVIDCGTGANAAFAIMNALRHRDQRGKPSHIDISLFDVAVSWMGYWIANYDQTGELPERAGRRGIGSAPNGVFTTVDGTIYICTMTERMYERLCKALNCPGLLADERFETMDKRLDNRSALREELHAEFESYTSKELEKLLVDARVPAGAVRTVEDIVNDPHVNARGMTVKSYNPETDDEVRVSTHPFRFDGNDESDFSSPPPEKGEHTAEILQSLSLSDQEIKRLKESETVHIE